VARQSFLIILAGQFRGGSGLQGSASHHRRGFPRLARPSEKTDSEDNAQLHVILRAFFKQHLAYELMTDAARERRANSAAEAVKLVSQDLQSSAL
jgi:hypothetical protein